MMELGPRPWHFRPTMAKGKELERVGGALQTSVIPEIKW